MKYGLWLLIVGAISSVALLADEKKEQGPEKIVELKLSELAEKLSEALPELKDVDLDKVQLIVDVTGESVKLSDDDVAIKQDTLVIRAVPKQVPEDETDQIKTGDDSGQVTKTRRTILRGRRPFRDYLGTFTGFEARSLIDAENKCYRLAVRSRGYSDFQVVENHLPGLTWPPLAPGKRRYDCYGMDW